MELMDMWVNCYKEIPFQTCKERFDVVGPMPRKVFDIDMSPKYIDILRSSVKSKIQFGSKRVYESLNESNYSAE